MLDYLNANRTRNFKRVFLETIFSKSAWPISLKFFSLIIYIIVLRMDEGFFFGRLFFYSRKCEWNCGRINNFEFQHLPFFRKNKIFQIPSSIRSIMSITNNPFFLFHMIQWRAAVITAKPFFFTSRKFAISHVFLSI